MSGKLTDDDLKQRVRDDSNKQGAFLRTTPGVYHEDRTTLQETKEGRKIREGREEGRGGRSGGNGVGFGGDVKKKKAGKLKDDDDDDDHVDLKNNGKEGNTAGDRCNRPSRN